MEKIMSKTNDTSNLAALEDHDALADNELDSVNGGLVVSAIFGQPLIAWNIDRPPANAAAMAAWKDLLSQNGF